MLVRLFLIATVFVCVIGGAAIGQCKDSLYACGDPVLVDLGDGILLNFCVTTSIIVQDDLYALIDFASDGVVDYLIDQMGDTTSVDIVVCGSGDEVSLGVISFLSLWSYYQMPYYSVFGIDFDSYLEGCPYPIDLLRYVRNDPSLFAEKLRRYFSESKPKLRSWY